MADPTTRNEDDVRVNMRALYGQDAEMPRSRLAEGKSITQRIGDLAKQVTEAADMLAEARDQYQRAAVHRQKSEASFAAVSEALARAIHEHREGTPENVPYGP